MIDRAELSDGLGPSGQVIKVVGIEHMISITSGVTKQKVCVFKEMVPDTPESRSRRA